MNTDSLVAIDVHTHAMVSIGGQEHPIDRERRLRAERHFRTSNTGVTAAEIATYYRNRNIGCVVFAIDAHTRTGRAPVSSEEIAEVAAANSDVLIPFGSIDPWTGPEGARRVRTLIRDHGVRGFKFHPGIQEFLPNDRRVYPIYEAIAEAGLPVTFHTGHTGMGAGEPGGGGIRLKYSDPLHLDDVAADFPELRLILAHPSFPWQDVAISIALHKPNVYIDLSGWSPRYFPPQLVTYANTLLRTKVLFGTDYPLITPDRWLDDFAQEPFRDEVRELILKDNAVGLLGLARASDGPRTEGTMQPPADARNP